MAYFIEEEDYENSLAHYGVKGMKWGVRHDRPSGSSGGYTVARKKPKKVRVRNDEANNVRYIEGGNPNAGVRSVTKKLQKASEHEAKATTKASAKRDIYGTMSSGAKYLNTLDTIRAQAKNDADKYAAKASKVDAKQAKRVQNGKDLSSKLEKKSAKYVLKAANNDRIRKNAEYSIQRNVEAMTKGGYTVHTAGTQRGVVSARNTAAIIGGVAVAGVIGGVAGGMIAMANPKKVSGTQYSLSRDNVIAS